MFLRFLPIGAFMYLVGGMLFGFGIGFGASAIPGYMSLASTGLGSIGIMIGYFILRPLFKQAKAQIKARTKSVQPRQGDQAGAGAQ